MNLRFTARAQAELVRQIDWLAARSPKAAWAARDRIFATLDWLSDFPSAGVAIDEAHREFGVRFGRDGFVVRYRVEGTVVIVVRVLHGRQDRQRQP